MFLNTDAIAEFPAPDIKLTTQRSHLEHICGVGKGTGYDPRHDAAEYIDW